MSKFLSTPIALITLKNFQIPNPKFLGIDTWCLFGAIRAIRAIVHREVPQWM